MASLAQIEQQCQRVQKRQKSLSASTAKTLDGFLQSLNEYCAKGTSLAAAGIGGGESEAMRTEPDGQDAGPPAECPSLSALSRTIKAGSKRCVLPLGLSRHCHNHNHVHTTATITGNAT